jgi:hypothetical protein
VQLPRSWCTCGLLSVVVRRVVFDPLVRPRPHGLFTQDPEFWKTVHLGGDGWEDCLAQRAAAAKQEWVDKVVVKDVHFHALPGTGDKAAAQVRSNHRFQPCTPSFSQGVGACSAVCLAWFPSASLC